MRDAKKILSNAFWLIGEKLINLVGMIFVTSLVAKYLGPENFGKLNFAIYIFGVIQVVSIWGTDTLCVKRISQKRESGIRLLFSLSKLRMIVFFLTSLPTLLYIYFSADVITFYFSLAISVATFITIQDVYIIANDATFQSKKNVYANIIGIVISLIVRLFIVKLKLNIIFLCVPIVFMTLIPFLIRFFSFKMLSRNDFFLSKKLSKFHNKFIFFNGFPLVLSSVFVAIYFNVSRLMLGSMDSMELLGVFSVSITLGSAWSFVNTAFVTALTPKLYGSKSKVEASEIAAIMSQLIIFFGIIYLSFYLSIGKFLITELYGQRYNDAFFVTIPIIISTTLSSLGMPTSRYIVYSGGHGFLGKKTTILCFASIIVSYLCIKFYSIYGAAYATLIIELFSLTFLNYFYKKDSVLDLHKKILNLLLYRKFK